MVVYLTMNPLNSIYNILDIFAYGIGYKQKIRYFLGIFNL